MELIARHLSTHFERIGQGPILVLLHGWGCDWQIFAPIISHLSADYQLVIPDLPAFGQTHTAPEVWGTPEYCQWLADFLQQTVGKKPFVILGHSYGARLAAWYAATNQSGPQPTALLLCDASGIPNTLSLPKRLQQRLLKIVPQTVKNQLSAQFKQRLLDVSHSSTDHFYANAAQKKILQKVVREDIRPLLPAISVPTLLLWGETDPDTTLNHGQQFKTLIPGAELSIFAGVGHFPFIEQPDRFVREINSFYPTKA